MSYAIVYSSRTGNTARLAKALQEFLPEQECVYVGPPDPKALSADTLYVGFWTDKGTCDAGTAGFLPDLREQSSFCSAQPVLAVMTPTLPGFWTG